MIYLSQYTGMIHVKYTEVKPYFMPTLHKAFFHVE